jgi:hypothetical protein
MGSWNTCPDVADQPAFVLARLSGCTFIKPIYSTAATHHTVSMNSIGRRGEPLLTRSRQEELEARQ